MVAADFIVGIIGNIVSIISYAAPIGTFMEMVKKKSAEHYDGSPYVTSLLSCCLWTLYGVLDPDDGILIVTVNAVGVASQVVYLAMLLFYYPKDKKVKYIGFVMLDLVFFGAVMAITLVAFHDGARRTFMGVFCATFTIVMYAAPLTVVKTVIKTKSVEYMPFFLILSLFLNAWVWFAFALLLKDFYVLVPNAVGIVLGAIQLLVYFIYNKSSPLPPPSKSTQTVVEEGSATDMVVKQDINMQDFEEGDEPKLKTTSQSLNNEPSFRNPSLSRQYSFKQFMRSLSSSPNGSRSGLHHGNDVENGGAKD